MLAAMKRYEGGDESYEDEGSDLAQPVYDALMDKDPEAFAVALKQYVQHCIDEEGGVMVAIQKR